MRINILTLTGKTITVDVERSDSVETLKTKIYRQEGIPPDMMSFVMSHGIRLEDGRKLSEYDIQPESKIHLILRLRGMISTFTTTPDSENDFATKFLMLRRLERVEFIKKHRLELVAQLQSLGGREDARLELWQFDITKLQLRALNDFADMMINLLQDTCAPYEGIPGVMDGAFDFKVTIEPAQLEYLLQSIDNFAKQSSEYRHDVHTPSILVKRFVHAHSRGAHSSKLAFRLTGNSTGSCIKFHRDGLYASKTVQMTLTDYDCYAGGDFVYFRNNRVHTPKRMAGTITRHGRELLHAVSALYAGTRKSLFVVNSNNGLGFKDVVPVREDQLTNLCRRIKQRFTFRASSHAKNIRRKAEDAELHRVLLEELQRKLQQQRRSAQHQTKPTKRKDNPAGPESRKRMR